MDLRRVLNLIFAVFVTVGLALPPLSTPAAIAHPQMAGMTTDMSMSADMPCCPDKQKSNDCHDCPVVAMCVSSMQAVPAAVVAILIRHPTRALLVSFDDMISEGLDRPPPDQPPRNLA